MEKYKTHLYIIFLIVLLIVQYQFCKKYTNLKPYLDVVPPAFNTKTTKAFTFGDDEFYFRTKVLKVQNMGDTFGRVTALKDYDYKQLYDWINNLDELNHESNFLPSISAYYFSQTQNIQDRIYPIKFLEKHAMRDINHKWWWLYQAAFIAQYDLKDKELAAKLAIELRDNAPADIPFLVKQSIITHLNKNNQDCESLRMLNGMIDQYSDVENEKDEKIKQQKMAELNYMRYFIEKIIKKLKENKIDVNKCLQQQ